MTCGKIYKSDTMFFREDCGSADGGVGHQYEMSINVGGATPIIKSKQTGKWFTLSWQDIIELAIEAGIDNADKKEDLK